MMGPVVSPTPASCQYSCLGSMDASAANTRKLLLRVKTGKLGMFLVGSLSPLGGFISSDKYLRQRGRKRLNTYTAMIRAQGTNAMNAFGVSGFKCRFQHK